jgi:hypothetical protein
VTERSGKKKWVYFAGRVPSFCGRVFTNGRDTRLCSRFGRVPITSNRAGVVRITMLRCEAQLLDRQPIGSYRSRHPVAKSPPVLKPPDCAH